MEPSIYPRKIDQQDAKIRNLEREILALRSEQETTRKRLAILETLPAAEKKKTGTRKKAVSE